MAPSKSLAILLTGGCGFIGSNVAARLAAERHRVVVLDWFGTGGKWRNLAGVPLVDVACPDRLDELLDRHAFDAIVHMGAISDTTERDVDLIVRTNIELSRTLLDHCTRTATRFIYASSAATYGDGALGFDDDPSLAALARLRPLNAYAWSKSVVDQMIARRRDLGQPLPSQCVGLKFFNVYGPNEHHKGGMRSVALKMFEQIANGEPVTLFKSSVAGVAHGEQKRDFVYVRDCVDVVAWCLDNPAVSGLFNVGSGQARSFLDLAHAVSDASDCGKRVTFVDMPEGLSARYQSFTEAKIDRLRAAGYVAPFTSLEAGIRDYARWHARYDDPSLAR